ncbi:YbaB/EbfC family nucleoid-associated protein [Micromonospora echinofusca]|uniref:YbaB/EbfC DNA-binding family protein n=1 Tax=Micromonospora echinofusca TaxID=47858 RepID=A0ABS3VXG0_MICEH|nr:YbaB/EbfC family nucleoid-associated protein [Micromonospora echinofusca]MBO4209043.1 hypothetical protein [Micromonospora echinofusca]
MASGFEAAINQMLAELAQQRENMTRFQDGFGSVSGTAMAPKRLLSVTVNAQGEITELKFLNQGYRSMAGAELASVIMTTIKEAQRDARSRLAEQVGSVGLPGAEVSDLVDGQVDWNAALNDALSVPQSFLDLLQRPPTDLLDGVDIDGAPGRTDGEAGTRARQQEAGEQQ